MSQLEQACAHPAWRGRSQQLLGLRLQVPVLHVHQENTWKRQEDQSAPSVPLASSTGALGPLRPPAVDPVPLEPSLAPVERPSAHPVTRGSTWILQVEQSASSVPPVSSMLLLDPPPPRAVGRVHREHFLAQQGGLIAVLVMLEP